MAFIPLIFEELGDILLPGTNVRELFHDIMNKHAERSSCRRRRHPWAFQNRPESTSGVKTDQNVFQVSLEVQQFSPEELTVKTLDNNFIVVEGKHEEKEDEHGYISRHFVRKYKLPEEFDSSNIESSLSSDGLLTVTSTKKVHETNEKVIPIKLTGPSKPNVAMNEENIQNDQEMAGSSQQ